MDPFGLTCTLAETVFIALSTELILFESVLYYLISGYRGGVCCVKRIFDSYVE